MHTVTQVDVIGLLREEREGLLRLLSGLSAAEWALPTECPAWTIKGIALHLLGDDLSLLSRQRDEEVPGVVVEARGSDWSDLMAAFDHFNEAWVEAASFFSPSLIIELLRFTGDWTCRWYTSVDPDQLGEAIHWISPTDPQPYWLLGAREYLERWIHHLQIRRAVGQPGLTEERFVTPALAITFRGFPRGWAGVPAEEDTTVTFMLTDASPSWTLQRQNGEWTLHDGAPAQPDAVLAFDLDLAAHLFSRGLSQADIQRRVRIEGDTDLAQMFAGGLAAFFAQEA
ncbi:MAG: hypothetical protein QOH26_902 [Actinomycetota bacterium]|jgi:uncharacterized protein (TIGR03083 family)|nr:hypothetical protein [Actinomycetota bacterium]